MNAAVWVPSLIVAAATVGAAFLAYRGSRRESVQSNEHRMIDQLQEERDHWQKRALAAELQLIEIISRMGDAD